MNSICMMLITLLNWRIQGQAPRQLRQRENEAQPQDVEEGNNREHRRKRRRLRTASGPGNARLPEVR